MTGQPVGLPPIFIFGAVLFLTGFGVTLIGIRFNPGNRSHGFGAFLETIGADMAAIGGVILTLAGAYYFLRLL